MTDQQPGYEPPDYGASSDGYGASGYGGGYGQGYGAYPAGYGAYGYVDPELKSRATMSFVFNIIACVLCCGIASLPGLICGGMAMSKAELEPDSARNLTKWAWICLGISVGLAVLAIVAYIVFIIIAITNGESLDD